MNNILSFEEFHLNEQVDTTPGKSNLQINKELLDAGKIKPGFAKFPCVMELPGYDLDKDGIIDVFGMDTQYFEDGTYKITQKNISGKYSCEKGVVMHDGKPVKGSAIKQVGQNQKFTPYDPKSPWITTGANKNYLKFMTKDPSGSHLILDLQKKLRSLGYLKSDKFLTGNFGKWTMQALSELLPKYDYEATPIGIYKEVYEKIMGGEIH